jgi:hypothetical protein
MWVKISKMKAEVQIDVQDLDHLGIIAGIGRSSRE